jgi:hypothetical protein
VETSALDENKINHKVSIEDYLDNLKHIHKGKMYILVIPLLEDILKEWGFLQVMTQVIGQELYQATLHPLPTGSRIMGGQAKE